MDITDAADHLSHTVSQRLFEEALAKRIGSYPAACGRTVLPVAMAAAPGRACPLCTAGVKTPKSTP